MPGFASDFAECMAEQGVAIEEAVVSTLSEVSEAIQAAYDAYNELPEWMQSAIDSAGEAAMPLLGEALVAVAPELLAVLVGAGLGVALGACVVCLEQAAAAAESYQ